MSEEGISEERWGNLPDQHKLVILGLTQSGERFRPSDWAERLAGVMSRFRPPDVDTSHLTYSPYVLPSYFEGVRCVIVDPRLRQLEPLAWKFVCGFGQDNLLQTRELPMSEPSDAP